ncbi:MAG: prepilin-type N-terminal cleavage/methylation domain-containing protein, partial [Candidatus Omnitrophica bacterium]|nr:prepilin-type N-terminal cleavage/methylation domain-containing protein [Candidatus Omnitrophota bacterium]
MTISNKAVTLIEILVATAIASMVLFGALLSTTALQKSANDFGSNYVNRSESSAVLDHILRNAGLAMGSDMVPGSDKGVLIGADETGDANTFC